MKKNIYYFIGSQAARHAIAFCQVVLSIRSVSVLCVEDRDKAVRYSIL